MPNEVRDAKGRRAPLYAAVACVILHPALFAHAQSGTADGDSDSQLEIGVEGGGGTYGWTGSCTSGTVSYGGMAGTVRYRHTSGTSVTVVGGGGERRAERGRWRATWGVGALAGYRGRTFGIEGGVLVFSRGLWGPRRIEALPAFRLRIGRLDNYHFRFGFADQVPVQRGALWFENAMGGLGPITIAIGVSMMPQLSIVHDNEESASISPYARIEGEIDDAFFLGASLYLSATNGVHPQAFGTFGVRL